MGYLINLVDTITNVGKEKNILDNSQQRKKENINTKNIK